MATKRNKFWSETHELIDSLCLRSIDFLSCFQSTCMIWCILWLISEPNRDRSNFNCHLHCRYMGWLALACMPPEPDRWPLKNERVWQKGAKTTPVMSQAKKVLNEGHGMISSVKKGHGMVLISLHKFEVTQETCRTCRREMAGSDSELFPSPRNLVASSSMALATHAWSNCFAICRSCRGCPLLCIFRVLLPMNSCTW
jgi:hypothetical protein